MHLVHAEMWDPQPQCKHASPLTPRTLSTRLTTASPAKRITFYKSGDSQFGGVRMAVHKRSFKCFDALLDDLSQKVPLPFGVRTVTTPRGTHAVKHLEQLQDGGCYLCSDRRQTKPVNMELAGKRPSGWYHHGRGPQRPESSSATPPSHSSHRQRRILLVKNSEPGVRRSLVLSRRSTRSLRGFLDEASELMQFHIRKLYTAEGRRIDNVQSLTTCPGVLVCVGREAFSPVLGNFIRKSSEEKLPGLGPRTPGNGARSPAAQARSPPHGAQSSEYSEGPESKRNVNFGLETKKSIIHPRSDSSNRSARFSLSSEKSYGNGVGAYSHARPAIMNDDIEKRVLVNKDGSLSVEMRVRFRLQSDETLQWSTQVKKSPPATNDGVPTSQAQADYLQRGQSESCSDPDSASFDPEGVDYSNQPKRALEGNVCPCCYRRPEQQYDLWKNPAHSHMKPPVPPPHASSRTHTLRRHTHSSSSSSSCNSRRVVRCRARVSSCAGGPEQSQLVREEMFVTEHVERRLEVEQDEETHIEVCRVSRCCSRTEVVAIDGDLRPLSRKSVEDEVMMEEDGARSPSVISCSSRVLQSLKGDQDDDLLPASASQCCRSNKPSPSPTGQEDEPSSNVSAGSVHRAQQKDCGEETISRAVSAASSCHCEAADEHSPAEAEEIDRAPSSTSKTSRASCRSSTSAIREEKRAADEQGKENRVVSSLSGHTGLSLQSRASSVCSNCGGCKLTSGADTRASQTSHNSKHASPKAPKPLPGQTDTSNGSGDDDDDDDDDAASDGSAGSTQSNKSNLTHNGRCCATPNGLTGSAHGATSRMSRTSNPELAETEEARTPSASSATSQRSNTSHNSGCRDSGATARESRSPSAVSAVSNKSTESHKSHCSAAAGVEPREEAVEEKTAERTQSSLSAKSGASAKSSASAKKRTKVAPELNIAAVEEEDKKTPSALSDKPGRQERPDSVLSAKSNTPATFGTSQSAACSRPEGEVSPADEPEATGQDDGIEAEERAVSVMSPKSNISVKSDISHKSTKAPERPLSPRCETGADVEGRAASQVSGRSVNGRSSQTVEEGRQRSESVISAKSASSAKSRRTNSPAKDEPKTEGRTPSAMSARSHTSAKSSKSQKSIPATASLNPSDAGIPSAEMNGDAQSNENGRPPSVLSVKSKASARSRASHKSGHYLKPSTPNANVTIKTPDGVGEEESEQTERPQSAASVKSTASTSSRKSQHSAAAETVDVVEEDLPRSRSQGRELSPKSACPAQTRSPKAASPAQQLLPGHSYGETRGPSALSVPSTVSAKSSKSKCSCGAASTKDERQREKRRSNEELDNEEASDRAASVLSSSTSRTRGESGSTEQPLSRNSSGSVSLGLPEDQDTADSDSGKSSVSFPINVERNSKVTTATPLVPESTEHSSLKEEREETPHNHRAVDIPTIETPGGSQHRGVEDGEQTTERGASAFSAKSSRSNKSSCNCGVKAAKPTEAGNHLETESVKSGSSASNAGALDAVGSSARAKARSKSPTSANAKNASVKSKGDDAVRSHKAKSSGGVRTSGSQKKEMKTSSPSPVDSNAIGDGKVETESTLSHSLSAADMLKETVAAARLHSQQSHVSKTSGKSTARKGARSRNEAGQEDRELSPACLPNASPNEVVSEWLRSIPANSGMLSLGDEPSVEEVEENPKEGEAKGEGEAPAEAQGKEDAKEGEEDEAECGAAEEKQSPGVAPHDPVSSRPKTPLLNDDSLPRSLRSSAAVMKILLRSSLSRCQSMPEVSPVYGRKLSSSARCLLDCLAQLQVIDPSLSPGFDPKKDQHYEDIMVILQSLWLTEHRNIDIEAAKIPGTEQVSPPRSSSGLGMSSGSGGSGKEKENGNQPGGDTTQSKTNEAEKAVDGGTPDEAEGPAEEQSSLPPSVDNAKATESPSSSDKSSANGCCKSPTDNERETPDDTSSTTPSTVLRAHDPDPVWVLNLLKKLEKQFMDHYVHAMAEFKVRWDLGDNLVLNAMIGELKDEVSRRIQSSVECEVRKIQSRAGRGGRLPRPPQRRNLSKESTLTENRRRILKVIKNQSRKTAEALSDDETTGDCSDQRSDDEYCPCDTCVLKKMAARPVRENPLAAEAPVMMEFDLLKILQLKKTPAPAAAPAQLTEGGDDRKVSVEEGRSLEVLQEVEEEEEEEKEKENETKEDIKACVVLEETIPEEDEEMEEEEDMAEAGVKEVEAEREEGSAGEEQEEGGGEEAGEEETSENGEEEEAECKCQSARTKEGEEETTEGEDAEETGGNTGEDETGDDGEEEEEEEETGTGEEESDVDTVKEAAAGEDVEEEEAEGGECEVSDFKEETSDRDSLGEEASGQTEDDDGAKREESTLVEEFEEGDVNASVGDGEDGEGESDGDKAGGKTEEQGGEASEEERALPQARGPSATDGEDFSGKRPSDTGAEEGEGRGSTIKEGGALLHQYTRTSVESQPGSMEDADAEARRPAVDSMAVPKATGGGSGQRRSPSPGRVQRRKREDF
ncbi:uncharacterized protein rp1l1a isoform 1-T2 [Spinachia spinachia]